MFLVFFYKKDNNLFFSLFCIIFPWFLYFCFIILFQVNFVNFDSKIFFYNSFLIFLSLFFCIVGYKKSINLLKDKNYEFKKAYFLKFYFFFIILGIIGSLATIIERSANFYDFINYSSINELYKLRYKANITEGNLRIENKIEYLKIFYPFAYLSVVPIKSNWPKIKYARYISVFLFLVSAIMLGGRFNFLYFFLGLVIYAYFNKNNILSLKNLIIFLIFIYLLSLTFILRSPYEDILSFYKIIGGITSISFLGLNNNFIDQLFEPFYSLITYYIQSANHLSVFYNNFEYRDLALGGYQFSIIFNIFNSIFDFNLPTVRGFILEDSTIGLFSTFSRDLYADFGFIGPLIFSIISGYLLGYYSNKIDYWFNSVIYYYLIIFFLLSPQITIYTDFILLMHLYIILFLLFKNDKNFKKN